MKLVNYPASLLCLVALLLCGSGRAQETRQQEALRPEVSQQEIRQVAARFAAAFEGERWAEAAELGETLVQISPKNHVHPYNLACAYARGGLPEKALVWLQQAAEAGFSDPEQVLRDQDLKSLRGDPRFAAALDRIEANDRQALEIFQDLARGSEPWIFVPEAAGRHPVLLALHGYGDTSEKFFSFLKPFAQRQGLVLVVPRTVIPTPNGGFEWGRPAEAHWLLREALKKIQDHPAVDRERIALLGFSQGAQMAFQSLARDPQPFWGAILIGTRPSPALLETTGPDRLPPLFLMAGGEEPAATANRLAAKALERDGFRVKLTIYPGVGHSFPPTWEGELHRALKYFAKAQEDSSGPAGPTPVVGDSDLGGPRTRSRSRQTTADQETQ